MTRLILVLSFLLSGYAMAGDLTETILEQNEARSRANYDRDAQDRRAAADRAQRERMFWTVIGLIAASGAAAAIYLRRNELKKWLNSF